jgi:hypothetical protein
MRGSSGGVNNEGANFQILGRKKEPALPGFRKQWSSRLIKHPITGVDTKGYYLKHEDDDIFLVNS